MDWVFYADGTGGSLSVLMSSTRRSPCLLSLARRVERLSHRSLSIRYFCILLESVRLCSYLLRAFLRSLSTRKISKRRRSFAHLLVSSFHVLLLALPDTETSLSSPRNHDLSEPLFPENLTLQICLRAPRPSLACLRFGNLQSLC